MRREPDTPTGFFLSIEQRNEVPFLAAGRDRGCDSLAGRCDSCASMTTFFI